MPCTYQPVVDLCTLCVYISVSYVHRYTNWGTCPFLCSCVLRPVVLLAPVPCVVVDQLHVADE